LERALTTEIAKRRGRPRRKANVPARKKACGGPIQELSGLEGELQTWNYEDQPEKEEAPKVE